MARFYRTRNAELESSIYIQEEDYWRTVSPEGGAADHDGVIPPGLLAMSEEISGKEAARMLAQRRAKPSRPSAVLTPEVHRIRSEPSRWLRASKAIAGALIGIAIIAYAIYQFYPLLTTNAGDRESWEKAEALTTEGDAAYDAGNYDQAIALYEKAISSDAGYGAAYHGKTYALLDKGDYEAAERWALTVTQRFPSASSGWSGLGHARENLGKLDLAIAAYERALSQAKEDAAIFGKVEAVQEQKEELESLLSGEKPSSGPVATSTNGAAGLVTSLERRIALLKYESGVLEPRRQIRIAIDALMEVVNSADDPGLVMMKLSDTQSVIFSQLDVLEHIAPPEHFADYHSEMCASYHDLVEGYSALSQAISTGSADGLDVAVDAIDKATIRGNTADGSLDALLESYWSS